MKHRSELSLPKRFWREVKGWHLLFLTHTPWAYQVGQQLTTPRTRGGSPWEVMSVDQIRATRLQDGSLAPCFEVWGKPVTPPPEVLDAARP